MLDEQHHGLDKVQAAQLCTGLDDHPVGWHATLALCNIKTAIMQAHSMLACRP